MVKLLITAGNAGCGWYAIIAFAKSEEITQVILTARSAKKAETAIEGLMKETGKPREVGQLTKEHTADGCVFLSVG